VIVEFTGLPGSGKSTLNEAVREVLLSQGYQVWTPKDYWQSIGLNQQSSYGSRMRAVVKKATILVRAATRNLSLMAVVPWRLILMRQSFRHQLVILDSFFSNLAEFEAADRLVPNNTIVLLDEGMVHRAVSLFVVQENSINLPGVIAYGRAIRLPDFLVYVRSTIPISLRRIIKRGVPLRMEKMDEPKILAMLVREKIVLDTLIENVRSWPSAKLDVIELNGENMAEAKQKLLDCFDRHLPPIKS